MSGLFLYVGIPFSFGFYWVILSLGGGPMGVDKGGAKGLYFWGRFLFPQFWGWEGLIIWGAPLFFFGACPEEIPFVGVVLPRE